MKKGDIIKLKSGGPIMTLEFFTTKLKKVDEHLESGEFIQAIWFHEPTQEYKREIFSTISLKIHQSLLN